MIRIMYVLPSLKKDGPNNQMFYLLSNLQRDKYEAVIVSLTSDIQEDNRFHDLGWDVEYCNLSLKTIVTRRISAFDEIVQKHSPDIIQSYGIRPDMLIRREKYNCHCVSSVRCSILNCYTADYGNIKGRIAAYFHARSLKDGRCVIACSESVKGYNKKLGINTYCVITNAIECNYRRLDDHSVRDKRSTLGISDDEIVLVSTGYLTEAKDPLVIAKAIRLLKKSDKDHKIKMVFLGDGPLRSVIENMNLDNVMLAGHVNNVSEWLDIADIYISGSHFEGMPNAALEAMRSALPLVLSDIPSHKEIIEHSKREIGLLFKCNDEKSLAAALCNILSQDVQHLGENAQAEVRENYGISRLYKQYSVLYEGLIND